MDEQRREAELNLLRVLLDNARDLGTELILGADSDLIDCGLLQALYGEAPAMTQEGLISAAKFFQSVIAPLAVAMAEVNNAVAPEAYLAFLGEILQAVANNPDPQQVYPLLEANLDKLDHHFAELLRSWAKAILPEAEPTQARRIAAQIGNLSIVIGRFPLGSRANNLEIEIAGYEVVATIFTREAFPQHWATLQNNLGNAYSDRLKGERSENLEIALACYENALQLRTPEEYPEQWATLQNNLGNAYSDRVKGDATENLELAVICYRNALQVRTRDTFPREWATTQNNLGRAYSRRVKGDRADNLEQAIECYQNALQVYNRKSYPRRWATTQNNLANAYSERLRGNRAENLEIAIECYQRALQVRTRETMPGQWATTQNNLGRAYSERLKGDRTENLELALTCFRSALQVQSRRKSPDRWASIQSYMGRVYSQRVKGNRSDNLELAIECYQKALQIYRRRNSPDRWAMLQTYLGRAYCERIKADKAENLEEAIDCYQKALRVYSRKRSPDRWAMLQIYLGRALSGYYRDRTDKRRNLKSAVACYENALQVYTRTANPQNHAKTLFYQGLAYKAQGELLDAYNRFVAAVETIEFLRGETAWGAASSGREPNSLKEKLDHVWTALYRSLVEVCLELANDQPHYLGKALEYVERQKARQLTEVLAGTHVMPKAEIPEYVLDELELLRQEIVAEQRMLERGASVSSTAPAPAERQDTGLMLPSGDFERLHQLQQRLDDWIAREVASLDPFFSAGQKVEPIAFEQIQELLPDRDTALIAWASLGDMFATFIVLPQAEYPQVFIAPPDYARALEGWAQEYVSAYLEQKGRWVNHLSTRLERLAALLEIDRIVAALPANCDRLILVPHHFLHLVPLHALPLGLGESLSSSLQLSIDNDSSMGSSGQLSGNNDQFYLIDRFTKGIRYAPSCQILRLTMGRRSLRSVQTLPLRQLFAIHNSTKDLIYSSLEVKAITQYFSRTEVLGQGDQALQALYEVISLNGLAEGAMRDSLQQGSCLHLACHGLLNFASPLQSALSLGEEALTLAEIFNLDLLQYRLVTLSACEMMAGEMSSLSEFIGLPAGFMYAGVPSVTSSLWKVSDVSTLFLMSKFYENLNALSRLQVGDVAGALNEAQRWLRSLTSEEFEELLAEFKPQITQIFAQLPQGSRLIAEASLQQTRNRKPCPFANPYHWAAFTSSGI